MLLLKLTFYLYSHTSIRFVIADVTLYRTASSKTRTRILMLHFCEHHIQSHELSNIIKYSQWGKKICPMFRTLNQDFCTLLCSKHMCLCKDFDVMMNLKLLLFGNFTQLKLWYLLTSLYANTNL